MQYFSKEGIHSHPCQLFGTSNRIRADTDLHRSCWMCLFHHCPIRRQSKTLLNSATLEIIRCCEEKLFSRLPTALHSASPPVHKPYGTSLCGSSLPINLYLSPFCAARSRHFSDVTAPAAFPKPAPFILHSISHYGACFFSISSAAASFTVFVFMHVQLTVT